MSRTRQESSQKERIRRADRLRPLVKREVDKSSVRQVEEVSGVSRTVIHEFVGGRTPQEDNLKDLERWAESVSLGRDEATGGAAPAPYNEAREEEEMARIGAISDPLLRIMERESIAAVIRAQGMRDACRAARLEAEKAVDRSAIRTQVQTMPLVPMDREVGKPGERKTS